MFGHLPSRFERPNVTFCINESMSYESNVFSHVTPLIYEKAFKELPAASPSLVARRAYELLAREFGGTEPDVEVVDREIEANDGHLIPIRIYTPGESFDTSLVTLFVHGGGWEKGNLRTHDTLCRRLSKTSGSMVVGVDYRLAPENPYPKGINDVETIYGFLKQEKESLGLNPRAKLVICGDSAGGNLAAALAVRRIQTQDAIPDALALFYPTLDLRIPAELRNPYAYWGFLTQDRTNQHIFSYLNHEMSLASSLDASPLLSPPDILNQFPPVILVSAECDLFTEQATRFVNKLTKQGKVVHHQIFPKVIHAFAQFFDLFPEAQQAVEFVAERVRQVL